VIELLDILKDVLTNIFTMPAASDWQSKWVSSDKEVGKIDC
jgi:hypothetical protein